MNSTRFMSIISCRHANIFEMYSTEGMLQNIETPHKDRAYSDNDKWKVGSQTLSYVASFSLPYFLSLSTVYFVTTKNSHLSNLKGNTPPDGSTHEMIGNLDLTGDEKIQSQHGHRVSRMCKIESCVVFV